MTTGSPDEQNIEDLIAALSSEEGMERKHAREKLVGMGTAATDHLEPLLTNEETRTRWEAAKALSEIADPESVTALVGALEDDEDDVCWLAAEGLARMGKPSVIPLLEALVHHDASLKLRQGAHHVFGKFKDAADKKMVEPVYKLLDRRYDDINVMMEAKRLLEKLS